MNFQDIYKKIVSLDTPVNEGGVTLPNPDGTMPPGAFTAQDQINLNNRMSQQAAQTPAQPAGRDLSNFNNEYLIKAVNAMRNGIRLRLLVTGPEAEAELKKRGVEVPVQESMGEDGMEECGMSMPPMPPKQQDNVTMNVSMNGSGAGGIRELMAILKNIEDGGNDKELDIHPHTGHDHEEPVFGDMEEEFANSPETATASIDAVTATGNDLASKGAEAEKVNGGGNPFNVDEGLLSHLTNLYQEVKSR